MTHYTSPARTAQCAPMETMRANVVLLAELSNQMCRVISALAEMVHRAESGLRTHRHERAGPGQGQNRGWDGSVAFEHYV
jgi:hypothetical protein